MSGLTSDDATTCAPREERSNAYSDGKERIGDDMYHQQPIDVPGESAHPVVSGTASSGPSCDVKSGGNLITDRDVPTRGDMSSNMRDLQIPRDDRNFDPTMSGPPTFGESMRSRQHGSTEDMFQSRAFNGLSNNYVVFRNIGLKSENATFSFGYDDPQHNMGVYQNIIEAVNHYKPEPPSGAHTENLVQHTYGSGGTAYASIVSNMGGDTTTSMNSRFTDNDYSRDVFGHFGVDETDSPIASSTGGRCIGSRLGRMPRPSRRAHRATGSSGYSDADVHDDHASAPDDGLFEVPFNVCSMSRIIDPFKGFSKVHTNRAIRLLHFMRKGSRTVCSLESNACKLIQSRIKDYKVVAISVCGDNRSGKSYLASLLVNQPVKAFRCSEAYSADEAMAHLQGPPEGTVWAYVGIYEDKYAYIYLDFDGFEHHQQQRISMLSFAMLLSNCVICNIANPPRTGIYDAVRAMIDVAEKEVPVLDEEIRSINMDQTIEEFKKKTSFLLNKQTSLSKTFESVDHDFMSEDDSDAKSQVEDSDVWNPPIVHFVFRDCDGHVRCIDNRIYTPETLVEQGIFDHYTNIFNCNRRDKAIDFKNDMLDAFEVFSNRKYTTLACPVSAPTMLSMINRTAASNAGDALKRIFATLLAPANFDIMSTDVYDTTASRFLGAYATESQPDLMAIPSNMLNPKFCERLDEVKACVYQDTLSHAQSDVQLNGRMFINYLKLLIAHFNMHGRVRVKDATAILRDVHLKENDSISKEVTVQFLKGLKHHVVMHLPMEPRQLLSKCMRLRQKALQAFQMRVFGTPAQYREQSDILEKSLDGLIERLEGKNDKIAVDTATAMFEKCAKSLEGKMTDEAYTYEELLVDIAKMRKMFLQQFKGHSQVTERVFPQLSQQLYKTFDEYHPRTPAPNVSEISKRYNG